MFLKKQYRNIYIYTAILMYSKEQINIMNIFFNLIDFSLI